MMITSTRSWNGFSPYTELWLSRPSGNHWKWIMCLNRNSNTDIHKHMWHNIQPIDIYYKVCYATAERYKTSLHARVCAQVERHDMNEFTLWDVPVYKVPVFNFMATCCGTSRNWMDNEPHVEFEVVFKTRCAIATFVIQDTRGPRNCVVVAARRYGLKQHVFHGLRRACVAWMRTYFYILQLIAILRIATMMPIRLTGTLRTEWPRGRIMSMLHTIWTYVEL